MKQVVLKCALSFFMLCSLEAKGLIYFDTMLGITGSNTKPQNGTETSTMQTKAVVSLYFGPSILSIGPILVYETPNSNSSDYEYIAGGGLRIGHSWFLGAGGGYLERNIDNVSQSGYGGFAEAGKYFMILPRIAGKAAFVGYYKKVLTSGYETEIVEYGPSLGLSIGL